MIRNVVPMVWESNEISGKVNGVIKFIEIEAPEDKIDEVIRNTTRDLGIGLYYMPQRPFQEKGTLGMIVTDMRWDTRFIADDDVKYITRIIFEGSESEIAEVIELLWKYGITKANLEFVGNFGLKGMFLKTKYEYTARTPAREFLPLKKMPQTYNLGVAAGLGFQAGIITTLIAGVLLNIVR